MTNFETRLIAGLERHQYDINAQAHIAEQQDSNKQKQIKDWVSGFSVGMSF